MSSIGSLYKLIDLIPPPDYPMGGHGDWKRFVSANGFWPPEDYRMMIREYGVGCFGDWLCLIEPFPTGAPYLQVAEAECTTMRESKRRSPSTYPDWPLWPDAGGLLPWAKTASGDYIGWRTVGKPAAWTTLFWGGGGGLPSKEFSLTTVDFLVGLVQRSLGDPSFDSGKNPFVLPTGQRFLPAGS